MIRGRKKKYIKMKPIHTSFLLSFVINLIMLAAIPTSNKINIKTDEPYEIVITLIDAPAVLSVVSPKVMPVVKRKKTVVKRTFTPEKKIVKTVSVKDIIKPKSETPAVLQRKEKRQAEVKNVLAKRDEMVTEESAEKVVTLAKRAEDVVEDVDNENEIKEAKADAIVEDVIKATPIFDEPEVRAAVIATPEEVEENQVVNEEPATNVEDTDTRVAMLVEDGVNEDSYGFDEKVGTDAIVPLDRLTKLPSMKDKLMLSYPERARRENREGTVRVEITIDVAGNVLSAHVIESAGDVFDNAALDAINRIKFEPAMVGESPVSVRVTIPVKFKLM